MFFVCWFHLWDNVTTAFVLIRILLPIFGPKWTTPAYSVTRYHVYMAIIVTKIIYMAMYIHVAAPVYAYYIYIYIIMYNYIHIYIYSWLVYMIDVIKPLHAWAQLLLRRTTSSIIIIIIYTQWYVMLSLIESRIDRVKLLSYTCSN